MDRHLTVAGACSRQYGRMRSNYLPKAVKPNKSREALPNSVETSSRRTSKATMYAQWRSVTPPSRADRSRGPSAGEGPNVRLENRTGDPGRFQCAPGITFYLALIMREIAAARCRPPAVVIAIGSRANAVAAWPAQYRVCSRTPTPTKHHSEHP